MESNEKSMRKWNSLDAGSLIDFSDIKNFNGFGGCACKFGDYNDLFKVYHLGLDFGPGYYSNDKVVDGLSASTPVRAVSDGKIQSILIPGLCRETAGGYYTQSILLRHEPPEEYYDTEGYDIEDPASLYCHIILSVQVGEHVKRGQKIATLYDKHERDMWTAPNHLHLELGVIGLMGNMYPYLKNRIDPMQIIEGLEEVFRK